MYNFIFKESMRQNLFVDEGTSGSTRFICQGLCVFLALIPGDDKAVHIIFSVQFFILFYFSLVLGRK